VIEGAVQRTWLWSPAPFQTAIEEYAEAPGGKRLVQYHDKSRMEITNPRADRTGRWFITNGLLVRELVAGQIQLGDATFEPLATDVLPSVTSTTLGPSYEPGRPAAPPVRRRRARREAIDRPAPSRLKTNGRRDAGLSGAGTSRRRRAFREFLNGEGLVRRGARAGRLFDSTFFATGLPITEPYWTLTVGGRVETCCSVLRASLLTHTPSNPPAWRVEWATSPPHYRWRYRMWGATLTTPPITRSARPYRRWAEAPGWFEDRAMRRSPELVVRLRAHDWRILSAEAPRSRRTRDRPSC
jgi:hypothetical protein